MRLLSAASLGAPEALAVSRRVVVPAQLHAPWAPCTQGTLPALAPLYGGGLLGVTGVVIPGVMAALTTAGKGSGARLRAGSARGMACRQRQIMARDRDWNAIHA
jgi:hypothetical protein